jgi:homogentisate 1,2-dioxygenase
MIFIHREGNTHYDGNIPFEYGDYLLSRGELSIKLILTAVNRLLYVESRANLYTKTIQNESGQHLEHAPFCERDFILPTELETHDEKGDFLQN